MNEIGAYRAWPGRLRDAAQHPCRHEYPPETSWIRGTDAGYINRATSMGVPTLLIDIIALAPRSTIYSTASSSSSNLPPLFPPPPPPLSKQVETNNRLPSGETRGEKCRERRGSSADHRYTRIPFPSRFAYSSCTKGVACNARESCVMRRGRVHDPSPPSPPQSSRGGRDPDPKNSSIRREIQDVVHDE